LTTHEDLSNSVSNLSPKLAINWRPNENLLFYGSSSLSYRAGTYSVFNFHPQILEAETERTWANEIGAKAFLFDRKLELALAGFWYQIDDYQIERYVLGGFGVYNAKQVETRGVELEARWRPLEGLELSAGIGYVDARFTEHRNPATGEDLSGKRPPYIPDVTANFAAQYRHACGFVARAEWILTGDAYFEDENLKDISQDGYGLLNARIGYERDNWGIYLFGNNLTDTEYHSLKIRALGAGIPGEPRRVGMVVKAEF
jgi:iron complex outermembrane receptor protein